jgi:hypothetical protein
VRRWRALEEGEDCEDGEDGVEPDLSIHREVGKELKVTPTLLPRLVPVIAVY